MSRRAGTPRTPDEPAFLAAKEAGLRPGSRFIPRPESEQTAPAQEAGVPILLKAKKNPTVREAGGGVEPSGTSSASPPLAGQAPA